MLVAAIGCNIAWGFVDGVMYVLRNLVTRARKATLMRAVREAAEPAQAHGIISQEIGNVSRVLGAAEFERMRRWIVDQPASANSTPGVTGRDLQGAVAVFLLVFLSTFPVVLPFVFIADPGVAKRVSAAVAIAMLFACGLCLGPLCRAEGLAHGPGHGPARAGGGGHRHRARRLRAGRGPARS